MGVYGCVAQVTDCNVFYYTCVCVCVFVCVCVCCVCVCVVCVCARACADGGREEHAHRHTHTHTHIHARTHTHGPEVAFATRTLIHCAAKAASALKRGDFNCAAVAADICVHAQNCKGTGFGA